MPEVELLVIDQDLAEIAVVVTARLQEKIGENIDAAANREGVPTAFNIRRQLGPLIEVADVFEALNEHFRPSHCQECRSIVRWHDSYEYLGAARKEKPDRPCACGDSSTPGKHSRLACLTQETAPETSSLPASENGATK